MSDARQRPAYDPFSTPQFAADFVLLARTLTMGGFGSGRPGWHLKVEHTRSLDVNRLHKAGRLTAGASGGWQWSRGGERVAYIDVQATSAGLRLDYRVRARGEEWESIDYTVPLTWSPCTKGGSRPYFLCPGVRNGRHCGRRVAKLYSGGRYFLCRHCYALTYESRSEQPYYRLLRRANKLRQAMGGEPGMASPLPSRRKGQWHKAYEARLERLFDLEEQADIAFGSWFSQRFPSASVDDLFN